MSANNITRRNVLRGAAAGAAATGMAGTALAQGPPERKIVGLTADAPVGLARQAADEVHHELDFDHIGKAIVGKFPETALNGLENNPHVRYVEDDQEAFALQTVPWGVDRVGGDVLHANNETGAGASIAIIDTGVQVNHETLDVVGGAAFGTTCGSCPEPYGDDNGHGTHCAGTAVAPDNGIGVVGVSLDSDLYSVKVLDGSGGGSFADVAAGIEWTADQGIDVASLSLGGASHVQALEDACEYAVSQGTLVVAAAGNDFGGAVGYPAAYDSVIAVSSTDSNDNLSNFSSTGPEVEIAAPGSDVYSTYINNGYDTLSGTSMACPHVAGAAAHLMANGYTNSEARQQLRDTAEDIGLAPDEQGYGLLDAEEAVLGTGTPPDPELSVTTGSATGVGDTSATLNGTLNDLGDASSADVHFEWGTAGSGLPNTTSTQTLSSTGSFDANISGLSEGTDYEFRAVAQTFDDSDTGATQSFTTDSDDGGCFITTATAGEGQTLTSLRRFRDDSMATTPLGRAMIQLYYKISPPIADTLAAHPESRTARACRRIVDVCASLSDKQSQTDSRVKSASLGVALTMLYMVGIAVGAGGHAGISSREMIEQ